MPDCGVSVGSSSKGGDIGSVTCAGGDSTIMLQIVLGSDERPGAEGSKRNAVGCMSKESEDEFRPSSSKENDLFEMSDIGGVIGVLLSRR